MALDEKAGGHMHGGKCEPDGRDIRGWTGPERRRWVEGRRCLPVLDFLIADCAREPHAIEFVCVTNPGTPVVAGFRDRRRVDEPVPTRAVIADDLSAR